MLAPSTPSITTFDPDVIAYQRNIIQDVRCKFDYSLGTHEIMMSGSIGSAKSTLMAHIALTHCLFNIGARFLIGRLSMPALRATLFNKILEHIGESLVEGKDFWVNQTTATIKFKNGSEIISRSWADKKYYKVRSLELSGAAIEEIIENDTQDFYDEIKMRVGRLPHIKENIIISATNPGSPSAWQYKYFIEKQPHQTRHVYYSRTEDNPFLPKQYIEQLKNDLDPRMAKRMLEGIWLEISDEVIYYAYDKKHNFINQDYKPNIINPIWISWDFNIAANKPLSLCLFQYIDGVMHIFDEVVVEGMRTADSLDELDARGLLNYKTTYLITGDAAGKHKDTRSNRSDYAIIEKYFANRENTKFEMKLFKANPPIRKRHNLVNAQCHNANGDRSLFVYKKAKTVDEGLRLTNLKKGGQYIEDDSKPYQHVTTAVGYGLYSAKIYTERKRSTTIRL